jgi:Leucine-rich repeat (LRR) protein
MELNPNNIYEDYINKRIDKSTAVKLLISIIENYDNNEIRKKSITVLGKLEISHENLFYTFENLLLSDSSEIIREAAAIYLSEHHLQKSIAVLKWAIQHEKSYQVLLIIIKALVKINLKESNKILVEQVKKIRKIQYINPEKKYENKKYKELLKPLVKKNKIIRFSPKQLGDILINFFTLKYLIEELPNVYFELNSATLLVEKLDISDYLEFEVKGTPWGWKNNIESISKIKGLKNLSNLQELNLANNRIRDLREFVEIKSLKKLDLSNNKVSDPQNIEYLKQIPQLEFVDLRGNELANIIKSTNFSPKTKVLVESSLYDLEKRWERRFQINDS